MVLRNQDGALMKASDSAAGELLDESNLSHIQPVHLLVYRLVPAIANIPRAGHESWRRCT